MKYEINDMYKRIVKELQSKQQAWIGEMMATPRRKNSYKSEQDFTDAYSKIELNVSAYENVISLIEKELIK